VSHVFLILACVGLLATIAAQDWLYPALRNETISSGLTGPFHAALDAAYVPVALAVALGFLAHPLTELLAVISAIALILVAVTNTAWVWVDSITKGRHALWHSRFTLVVFISVLALEVVADHGWHWGVTAANVISPMLVYVYFSERKSPIYGTIVQPSPAAEKLAVAIMCVWLITYSL